MFGDFYKNAKNRFTLQVLAFSTLEDKSSLKWNEHVSFLTYVFELFSKSWITGICIFADIVRNDKSVLIR